MARQNLQGWPRILFGPNPFLGEGHHPIAAYSEFMPPVFVGRKPSGAVDDRVHPPGDPHGYSVSEYQTAYELEPGLVRIAKILCAELRKLGEGKPAFSKSLLTDNPYWPEALAKQAGSFKHEKYAALVPLALSRTLDDKGRVRWTLFGNSHEGPARPFWQSFYRAPGDELNEAEGTAILRRLLEGALGMSHADAKEVRKVLRVLPAGNDPDFSGWGDEPFPSWLKPMLLDDAHAPGDAKVLLTFRPFAKMPAAVQKAYLEGSLTLLPFPGSLVFFGHHGYRRLTRQLPFSMQIPFLHLFPGNHVAPTGIRIPQSGWLNEPRAHGPLPDAHLPHGHTVSHVKRTSRWNRTHRDEDENEVLSHEDRVAHVLFSTDPEDLGLYGKPMARNAQVWTHDYRLLLDGPNDARYRIEEAAFAIKAGGHFGYRFFFPPMRAGRYELYWHYPLCAVMGAHATEPTVIDAGSGYLGAYPKDDEHEEPVELWPRLNERPDHVRAVTQFNHEPGVRKHTTAFNLRKLLDAHQALGDKPLRRSFGRSLLTVANDVTLEGWLGDLAKRAHEPKQGDEMVAHVKGRLAAEDAALPAGPNTYEKTATRAFEEHLWNQIAELAEGRFIRKDNADPAGADADVLAARDLEALGDHLRKKYHELIQKHGMVGHALVGEHRFRWRTDFDFPWSGGWVRNQIGKARERNIVMVIPGNNRTEAVVMGDHYDTAYMEDVYDKARGGNLTRRAAAGADDNHSATTALLLAADVLLPLAKAGKLERDVWLVHLTGEEFPADCLGARNLVQRLVEGSFAIDADGHGHLDLSHVKVQGAFILDMVAHNNDRDRYEFQISPGEGALKLAYRAHLANERWNQAVAGWNKATERKTAGPSKRMEDGSHVPPVVAFAKLHGDVRPGWHFKSSLYNTDAQIFSDAGIPVVLFMENYDINRTGYHDTQDTMKNIDLDYGAALIAIAIETVADVAMAQEL